MALAEYFHAPLPPEWDDATTCRFLNYLDDNHDSDSDTPCFGFVSEGQAWCEDETALAEAMAAALAD